MDGRGHTNGQGLMNGHGLTNGHKHTEVPADARADAHAHARADARADTHEHAHAHAHAHAQTKAVLNRLARAIGHLTAVRGMVEEGRDCAEVLTQLAAVRSAINKTCEVILKDHLGHCIVDAVEKGEMDALDELNRAIELLMR